MEFCIKAFKKKHNKDLATDKVAIQKLKKEVENAKRTLSSDHQVTIEIEAIIDGIDFSEQITRAKFEDLNSDLFKETLKPVKQVLDDA